MEIPKCIPSRPSCQGEHTEPSLRRPRTRVSPQGPFIDMSPTGRRSDVPLIDIMRFGADGRVREHWGVFDQLAMAQQLGAIPSGPPA